MQTGELENSKNDSRDESAPVTPRGCLLAAMIYARRASLTILIHDLVLYKGLPAAGTCILQLCQR